jgi:rhodanese-related sulfurtransferase
MLYMKRAVMVFIIFVFTIGFFTTFAMSKDVPRITKEELKAMMDNPDVVIIDVRYEKHWEGSDRMIKGAIRENYDDVKSWADKYGKDKALVLYCA